MSGDSAARTIACSAHLYEPVNARLGVGRGPYEVALAGDNLLDKRGPTLPGNNFQ